MRGELKQVSLPGGLGAFSYDYWPDGKLKKVTRPAGASEEFDYDGLGRTTQRRRATELWLTQWRDGEGETVTPVGDRHKVLLDGRGRVARKSFAPGANSSPGLTSVVQTYDAHDGLLSAVEEGTGGIVTTALAYDARWRLEQMMRGTETVRWSYGSSDELASVSSPAGTTGYHYGSDGRLVALTGALGTTGFEWEPGGERLALVQGSGISERYCYDGAGRLAGLVSAARDVGCGWLAGSLPTDALSGVRYGYDARGNRLLEEQQTAQGFESRAYAYDLAGRLVGEREGSGRTALYQLRADGSREYEKRFDSYSGTLDYGQAVGENERLRYRYDARDGLESIEDELAPAKTRRYVTDASGRLLSEVDGSRSRQFSWDAAGRLVSMTEVQAASARTTSYGYDWANLRRWKRTSDGQTSSYLWAGGQLLEERIGSEPARLYQRAAGMVVGIGTERILHDGLGSVVGRIDSFANSSSLYQYDGWGNLLDGTGPTGSDPSLAYAGQHWDADAGLSYAQQRWYDPRLGRFLSEDPLFGDIANPSSLMAWGYANGNPLRYTDPTGEAGLDSVAQSVANRALRWLSKRGATVSAHVAKRHVARLLYAGKSKFTNPKSVNKLARRALKSPDAMTDQGRRLVFEKVFEREVGKGGERVVRVVVDKATGKIVTLFPSKQVLPAVVVGIALTQAEEVRAEITQRERAREEYKKDKSTIEGVVDFVAGSSEMGDEFIDVMLYQAEMRAVVDAEKQLGRAVLPEERDAIGQMIGSGLPDGEEIENIEEYFPISESDTLE